MEKTTKTVKVINPYRMFTGSFVPNWLLCRKELNPGDKVCYARLAQFAGKDGECFPEIPTLAEELGVSPRQVDRYLAVLKKFNLIVAIRRGLGKSNKYLFIHHEWMNLNKVITLSDADMPVMSDQEIDMSEVANEELPVTTLTETTLMADPSTKENQLRESEKETGDSLSLETDMSIKIKELQYKWRVFALAYQLSDKDHIDLDQAKICLADPLFDFDKIMAKIVSSKRLRGIGKGNSKADAVTFQSIISNDNFRQQIIDGVFDDVVAIPVVFEKSKYVDYKVFEKEMKENETFQKKYKEANIDYYWTELRSWAKRTCKKSGDWVEEGLNFMRLDTEKSGLKTSSSGGAKKVLREGYGQS